MLGICLRSIVLCEKHIPGQIGLEGKDVEAVIVWKTHGLVIPDYSMMTRGVVLFCYKRNDMCGTRV